MRTTILESAHSPKGGGMEEFAVVLCEVGHGLHPFVTWDECYPKEEDRKPYRCSGHYFTRKELAEAVKDFEKRCTNHGLDSYPERA